MINGFFISLNGFCGLCTIKSYRIVNHWFMDKKHRILRMQGIKACLKYIDHLISQNYHLLNNGVSMFDVRCSDFDAGGVPIWFYREDKKIKFGNYVSDNFEILIKFRQNGVKIVMVQDLKNSKCLQIYSFF
jgi:hypothetical protein